MNAIAQRFDGKEALPRVNFRAFGSPTLREYFSYIPQSAGPGSPVLALVHGITRRAAEQIFRFRDEADRSGAILIAPLFPKVTYGQYQQVVDRSGARADLALIEIVEDISEKIGAKPGKFHLFGFSGGAQFAHRFAMIHPNWVASLSLASAGWYTMPDDNLPYPYGIRTHPLPGATFDIGSFLAIERHIFVGSEDRFQDDALRSSHKLNLSQGANRVERAKRWAHALDIASRRLDVHPRKASLEVLKGVGHSFASSARRRSLPERVFQKLELGKNNPEQRKWNND